EPPSAYARTPARAGRGRRVSGLLGVAAALRQMIRAGGFLQESRHALCPPQRRGPCRGGWGCLGAAAARAAAESASSDVSAPRRDRSRLEQAASDAGRVRGLAG